MSYGRWTNGSVYVFASSGGFTCYACELAGCTIKIPTLHWLREHLLMHQRKGGDVKHALERVDEEIKDKAG
jgi:hypothetical protein